jgi:hypothetical protein
LPKKLHQNYTKTTLSDWQKAYPYSGCADVGDSPKKWHFTEMWRHFMIVGSHFTKMRRHFIPHCI